MKSFQEFVNEGKTLKNPDNNKLMAQLDRDGILKKPGLAVLKKILMKIEDGDDAEEAFDDVTKGTPSGIKKTIKYILTKEGIL